MIVYWVRIAAIGSTKISQPKPDVSPPNMPLLLMVLANTSEKLACCSGMKPSGSAITAAAPATCHHTETLLMTASRCDEKMLMIAEAARMITNRMNVLVRL